MKLHSATRAVIGRLEGVTGARVEIVEDPALPVIARITLDPARVGAFVLSCRPGGEERDYFLAYECAFALRWHTLPAGERFVFAALPAATEWMAGLVGRGATRLARLPEAQRRLLAGQLAGGLLTQLRSVPIGMRVAEWIREELPGLRGLQAAALGRELAEASRVLSSEVRSTFPDEVFAASAAMSSAHALFAERLLGEPVLGIPFRAAGFEELGQGLLRVWDGVPPGPEHDRELVDRWAVELGLLGLYSWQPAGAGSETTEPTQ